MFQQQPAGYQQPYGPPAQPPPPQPKRGAGGMIMAIIGGVMALIAAFTLFWISTSGSYAYMDSGFYGIGDLGDDYVYAWLIPIFGILVLVFGIIAYAVQNKAMAVLAGVFGLLVMILPLVLALHLSSEFESLIDVFFYSESYGTTYYSYSVTRIYLGGFMAMIGGLLGTIGGFSMMGKMR